jgi:glyoxylase-like metal-dependent hydrolase (beta-lactamase superfamily II)
VGCGVYLSPAGGGVAWQNNGIPVRAITTIILTHIHADHDAGTFQQIVKEV